MTPEQVWDVARRRLARRRQTVGWFRPVTGHVAGLSRREASDDARTRRGLAPLRHTLDNGAVVIVQETAATPAVTINATFLAGSLYEPDDLAGLAYLTGRVIDRGTRASIG